MRKLLTALLMLMITSSGYSQVFFDGGVKGYLSTTWLINERIFNNPDYVHSPSMGGGFGGKLGLNFNENVQIAVEAIVANFNQKFSIAGDNDDNWNKLVHISSLDFPFLIRHNKDNGGYFELGPQYSMVKEVTESYQDGNSLSVSNDFDRSYLSAVVGFGGYMMGWENFGICVGFRLAYSFEDIISKGGNGEAGSYKATVTNVPTGSYKVTNGFMAGLVIEFNYDLGYLAKSPCGSRREFLFFQ